MLVYPQKDKALAIWAALGLGAMGLWMNLVGYSTAFAPLPATAEALAQPEISRYAFYAGICFSGLLFFFFHKKVTSFKVYLDPIIGLLMCMGTASFGIAYQQTLFDPSILATTGCIFAGIGYNWFVCSLYLLLAQKTGIKVAIISILASLVFETVAAQLCTLALPEGVQIIIGSAMPPLVYILSTILSHRFKDISVVEVKLQGKDERYQILLLMIACLSLLVIRSVTTVGLWGNGRQGFSDYPLQSFIEAVIYCAVFILLGYFTLIKRSAHPLFTRYQMPWMVIVLGCFIFLIDEYAVPVSLFASERVIISAIELFGHLLQWTIVVVSIQTLRFSPFQILGAGAVFYNVLAIIWITFFEGSATLIPALVLMVVYLTVYAVAVAPLKLRQTAVKGRDDAAICGEIAKQYQLTKREEEILLFLMHGRSRPYIQHELQLADGTVKTHTTHIYTKLGIHTRQELLDLIECVKASGAG